MRTPLPHLLILAGVAGALLPISSHADTFGIGINSFTIDFVTIGNAGNPDDAGAGGGSYSSPYGGVSYVFRMGVTEVSQNWITMAAASGMTNVTAGAWTGNQPAANMTWYEAAGFVNWLNTSTGHSVAYNLNATNTALTLWTPGDAGYDPNNLFRNANAYYFLPSEDEWYKAAYHQNDGVTANYWDYATASNSIPTAVTSGTTPGTSVYTGTGGGTPADVASNGGLSAYGTRGQGGNIAEMLESAFDGGNDSGSENRVTRGGSYAGVEIYQRASYRDFSFTTASAPAGGFRVASVPEPSSTMLILSAGLVALARRRRHRRI